MRIQLLRDQRGVSPEGDQGLIGDPVCQKNYQDSLETNLFNGLLNRDKIHPCPL